MPPPRHLPARIRTLGGRDSPESADLARARLALATRERRLEESVLALDAYAWQLDRFRDGDNWIGGGYGGAWGPPADRSQDRSHAPLPYETEPEWRLHVALARDMLQRNHLALAARDLVCDFIGTVKVTWVERGEEPGASGGTSQSPLVREVNQAWKEWCEFVEWGEGEEDTQRECLQRTVGEGEATARFFEGDDNSNDLPHLRIIDPEFIKTPTGASLNDPWGWGVKTRDRDAAGPEEGICVADTDDPTRQHAVERSEYARTKINVDRVIKRGVSDFFPCSALFAKVLGIREALAHNAEVLSKLLWWEQFPTATEEQVRRVIQAGQDTERRKVGADDPSRMTSVRNYECGSVVSTEAGRVVVPPPAAVNTPNLLSVDAAVIRGLGYRFGFPAYFTGESDASFASVLVTGSPFVRRITFRQHRAEAFNKKVAVRFVQFCERSGRLPRGTCQKVKPVTECEQVIIADEEKKSRTFLAEYNAGVASPQAYIRSRGDDPKQVAADIAEWKKANPGTGGQQPPPGPDGAPGASDPAATPPGSAGGDGSSPNDDPMASLMDGVTSEALSALGLDDSVSESEGGGLERGDTFPLSEAARVRLKKTGVFTDTSGKKYRLDAGKRVPLGAGSAEPAQKTAGSQVSNRSTAAFDPKNPEAGGLFSVASAYKKLAITGKDYGVHAPGESASEKFVDQVKGQVKDHLKRGGKVTLWLDGKKVPIVGMSSSGMMQDAKGQSWGTVPLMSARPGDATGLEFHPVQKATPKPPTTSNPVKVTKPGASPKPTPADDEASNVAWDKVPEPKKAAAVAKVKAKADTPAGKAILAKADQWADAQAAKHAARLAKHLGTNERTARFILAFTIKTLCRRALEGEDATHTYKGADGKSITLGVRKKEEVGEHLEEARVLRKDGEAWQVGQNWYKKVAGKTRKIADPGKQRQPTKKDQATAAKATKTDNTAKAKGAADKLAAGGADLTHDDVKSLDDHFATLTTERMKQVARAIGAKLSGPKKELAARLVEHAKSLVSAGKSGNDVSPVRARLTAAKVEHEDLSDDDLAEAIRAHRERKATSAKAPDKPAPETTASQAVDATVKELDAQMASNEANEDYGHFKRAHAEHGGGGIAADQHASRVADERMDSVMAALKAKHTPDEIHEIAKRVTGKRGRKADASDSLALIRTDLTAVRRNLQGQRV